MDALYIILGRALVYGVATILLLYIFVSLVELFVRLIKRK